MNPARVVHLLDRHTVPIVKGIPVPPVTPRRDTWKALAIRTLRACAPGDSFLWRDKEIHRHAESVGIPITTRRVGNKWRVWRVA